ncbi:hypothetical protein [Rhodovulum steppense]|nr:hypothetical protein [Rhodovulum steppense]
MRLERVLAECLGGDRAVGFRQTRAAVDLPAPGAEEAARLIAETGEVS